MIRYVINELKNSYPEREFVEISLIPVYSGLKGRKSFGEAVKLFIYKDEANIEDLKIGKELTFEI